MVINGHTAAFVIPYYSSGAPYDRIWLDEALKSIDMQTDSDHITIIIDDASPDTGTAEYLHSLKEKYDEKIVTVSLDENKGPGNARNIGIKLAYKKKCPFVMFLDSDDIAHPKRVAETRRIFDKYPEAGVVYSSFDVIDENGKAVDEADILPSIYEIIEQHRKAPPQGKGVWKMIAVETGYVNLTSATNVRTSLAYKYPFPEERVSEDYYTWLVYSASGAEYVFADKIPAKYRIPRDSEGSRTRRMCGGQHIFNMIKSIVDTRGFLTALDMAFENAEIDECERESLMIRFCLRKARSMKIDGECEIALDFLRRAKEIDKDMKIHDFLNWRTSI